MIRLYFPILFLAVWSPVFAQVPVYTGRVVDLPGNGISGVKVRLTAVCFNPLFPGGITYIDDKETNEVGEYSVSVPVLGGSSCQNRQNGFELSKDGWFFDTSQAGGAFFPRGTHYGIRPPLMVSVSAASYAPFHTSDMIVAGFGENLSLETIASNSSLEPPEELAGRRMLIRDQNGVEKPARFFLISPNQINYILPPGLSQGPAVVRLLQNNQPVRAGFLYIYPVAPSIFTADSTGKGAAAAIITRVKPDDSRTIESITRYDAGSGRFVAVPVDLGPESERVYLSLFGTGWRSFTLPESIRVRVGGADVPVTYAGLQPTIAGLDQINILLPRSLAGAGEQVIEVSIDHQPANQVKINIR